MKKNIWFFCFITILFFEVFHHFGAIKSFPPFSYFYKSKITDFRQRDAAIGLTNGAKKYNVLFFEADYGDQSLGNGTYIFFIDDNKQFVLYSQLDAFKPNDLIYGKIINHQIVIDGIPKDTFRIINNNLVVHSEYKSSYSKFAFIDYKSNGTLEDFFKQISN
jgi:hypothetical protein